MTFNTFSLALRRLLTLCSISAAIALPCTGIQAADVALDSRSTKVSGATDPALYDIEADGKYEVLLSGSNGYVGVYRSENLKPIWERRISEKPVLTPVIGNFTGTGASTMAVVSQDGVVTFCRAGDGKEIAMFKLPQPTTVTPSVAPIPDSERDGLVVVDDSGTIFLLALDSSKVKTELTIDNTYQGQPIGRIAQPASIGDVDGDGSPDIVVGSRSGTVMAIPIKNPSQRYVWHAPQGVEISTIVGLADLTGSGKNDLVFGLSSAIADIDYAEMDRTRSTDNSGNLIILTFQPKPGTNVSFRQVQYQKLLGIPRGQILIADLDGDGYLDLAGASQDAVATFDGAAQFMSFGKHAYVINNPPPSPITLARRAGNKSTVLFGDKDGLLYAMDSTMQQAEPDRYRTGTSIQNFCLSGDLNGTGKVAVIFVTGNDNRLYKASLDIDCASATPMLCAGGNFQHDCQVTSASAARLAVAEDRFVHAFDALMADIEATRKAGDYAKAYALSDEAVAMRPTDPTVLSLRTRLDWRSHWFRKGLCWLIALGVAAAMARTGRRLFLARRAALRAEKLLHSGNYAEAVQASRELLTHDPNNKHARQALADAYVHVGDAPIDAAELLEEARRSHPENPEYSILLANIYARQGLETDAALETYLVALGTLEDSRGPIAFWAANILLSRNERDQALRYYKLATREGYNELPVYSKMAEIFLATNQYDDKSLPVFEVVSRERPDDVRLLEGLSRCYASVRRVDSTARAASAKLLELQPTSLIALMQLAKCALQSGNPSEAVSFAERASQQEPADMGVRQLLADCYLSVSALDEKARTVYRDVVAAEPERKDVLRMLAVATVAAGQADDEAMGIVEKASQALPEDIELLTGVATLAQQRKDTSTATTALEKIVSLGSREPAVYLQLSEIYLASSNFSSQTEPVFREALRNDPENQWLLSGLARVLIGQKRTDAETLGLLERAIKKGVNTPDVYQHLADTYLQNGRYADAVQLCRTLLQQSPNDDRAQKTLATAALRNGQLEDAVLQYEKLVSVHPDDAEVAQNLATAYAQTRQIGDGAAAAYERALNLNPGDARIRFSYATHHASAGRYARAIEEFRKTIATDPRAVSQVCDELKALVSAAPERTDLRWFLESLLVERGHLKEAMDQLQAILEYEPEQLRSMLPAYDAILAKDPGNLIANIQKGTLLKAQGRFEDSRPFLQKAYKINPQNSDAVSELEDLYLHLLKEDDSVAIRFELGKLYYGVRDYDKALIQFQKTCQDFRFENESIKMLGLCFAGKGMFEFALQEFRKLAVDASMKEILYDLAHKYEAKNDQVGAKQVYRLLFAADADYRDVKIKFEMLAGSTSDPMTLERTALMTQLGEKARRRYELLEELGRGAMGIVYKAHDNELEEMVALKILPDNLSQNPEALQRFRSEARSARRLAHPNIVRIHDIGEELGRKYISMEYVSGTDLKKHLKACGRLPANEVARIANQIGRALDYAHSMGIVHRDVKPANILLNEQGNVKVSDFGIAKILESTRSETAAGAVIGTPLYMSPEQIQGQQIDNRSDVYSLGVLLYELASGRPPFVDGDLAFQHTRVPPPPLEDVPEALAAIIMRCLEKNRDDRWAKAEGIVRATEDTGLNSST